jgi:hypothetical protein
MQMKRLKIIATWIPFIIQFNKLSFSHVIISTLNTIFFCQHYENINHDHNIQMSHLMFYKNKNTPNINQCAQIYTFTNIHIFQSMTIMG